jgi:hypothetical protein
LRPNKTAAVGVNRFFAQSVGSEAKDQILTYVGKSAPLLFISARTILEGFVVQFGLQPVELGLGQKVCCGRNPRIFPLRGDYARYDAGRVSKGVENAAVFVDSVGNSGMIPQLTNL